MATPEQIKRLGGSIYRETYCALDAATVSYGGGDQTLADGCRGIFIGGAGNLTCRLAGATSDVTFTGLSAGVVYPFAVSIIRQTGSTITNAVALF